jgi:hypothetical protein
LFSGFWIAKDFILNGLRPKDIILKGLAANQPIPTGNDSKKNNCNGKAFAAEGAKETLLTFLLLHPV